VLIGQHKVCGSAQRRLRKAVLQHGSLLLGRSAAAPCLAGIEEIAGRRVDRRGSAVELAEQIVRSLQMRPESRPLDARVHQRASRIEKQKYLLDAWTFRR
jgi:lipoate-protein ligase A